MRSYIRHPSDIPIEYRIEAGRGGAAHEFLNNISPGGLSFRTGRELPSGTVITICIRTVNPSVELKGQVAWCEPDTEGFVIGVAFLEKDDLFRLRMVEQICHIEHYKTRVQHTEGRDLTSEEAAREWIQKFAGNFPPFKDSESG